MTTVSIPRGKAAAARSLLQFVSESIADVLQLMGIDVEETISEEFAKRRGTNVAGAHTIMAGWMDRIIIPRDPVEERRFEKRTGRKMRPPSRPFRALAELIMKDELKNAADAGDTDSVREIIRFLPPDAEAHLTSAAGRALKKATRLRRMRERREQR